MRQQWLVHRASVYVRRQSIARIIQLAVAHNQNHIFLSSGWQPAGHSDIAWCVWLSANQLKNATGAKLARYERVSTTVQYPGRKPMRRGDISGDGGVAS